MAATKTQRDAVANSVKSAWDRVKKWWDGCGCFVAGTLVATSMGLTPIEAIEVGDQVWARDEVTGEVALKPVTALIRPPQRVIWKVTFAMDEGTGVAYAEFEVTDDHPWGRIDGTWLRTDELKPGMEILRAHGVPARVMSVVQTERTEPTYNLEVADFHTYFVGEDWVWVHNARACDLRSRMGEPPPGMKKPQAQHDLPQAERFQQRWKDAGLDNNDPAYGRWVEGGPVGNHQKWSHEFNQEWDTFFERNPNANREQILEQMEKLRTDPRFQ